MPATMIEVGSLIERRPGVRSGRPCLAGTGVTVHRVVGWYKLGMSPEEIVDNYGHISLAQVHAALAYYHANREQIDADLAAELAQEAELARQYRSVEGTVEAPGHE
jgi:uncharacterized protein (DUF433 family)